MSSPPRLLRNYRTRSAENRLSQLGSPRILRRQPETHPRNGGTLLPLLLFLSLMFGSNAGALAADAGPQRFEPEIQLLERRDVTNPPPAGPVLFVGSSSVVKWTQLTKDFAGFPVLNHGFGGSTWQDLNYYFPRVVPPVHPRAVVVYEGDNDLAAGRSVAECLADFERFHQLMRAQLPGVPVAVLAVKPSPSRHQQDALQIQLNDAIRKSLVHETGWSVLDVASVLRDASGAPRPEFFESDRLHLNRAGYAQWLAVVHPWVERIVRR